MALRDPPKPPLNRPFSLPSDASTPESETPTASRLASPSLQSSTLDPSSEDIASESSSASEDSSSSASEDGSTSSKPGMLHNSSSSLLMANAFAPPFYNRPPTPLPPSPSLTSLLRPPFSTTTSRPSTPDSSENDTPNETESAVTKSARIAAAVPRASPKVPTYEYYGFVLYLLSSLAFCSFKSLPFFPPLLSLQRQSCLPCLSLHFPPWGAQRIFFEIVADLVQYSTSSGPISPATSCTNWGSTTTRTGGGPSPSPLSSSCRSSTSTSPSRATIRDT